MPHVRAGVGAVCTQASTVVEYGPRGLDLLAKGVEPQAALAQLLADDQQRESRQVGLIDMQGRSAAHTGKQNGNWAGSQQGKNYTVQANIMVGPEVVDAVAATFEATEGTGMALAERMILAMEAGYAKGGDRRWGNLQSAAIKIADPNDPGRGNDHIALAIEVGEHPEPVAELKRIYYTTGRRLGYRTFSQVRRRRRHRAEAHAACARLLASVAGGVSGSAGPDQLAAACRSFRKPTARSTTSSSRTRARSRPPTTATTRTYDDEADRRSGQVPQGSTDGLSGRRARPRRRAVRRGAAVGVFEKKRAVKH